MVLASPCLDRSEGVVLGIDAAWTPSQPSGVALVERGKAGWRLAFAASSYAGFCADRVATGALLADAGALLSRSESLAGRRPDVVAIDMPLARTPITMRRAADNAVSAAYGARHCSTHTPSAMRPGPISDRLTEDFCRLGFPLATDTLTTPALVEVYPHPALVELTGAARRLPYKVGKIRNYWPEASSSERRSKLIGCWRGIVAALQAEIENVANTLTPPPPDAPARTLKAFEDQLDAVVCAWVGICVLEGRARPFGNADAAIWIPDTATAPAVV